MIEKLKRFFRPCPEWKSMEMLRGRSRWIEVKRAGDHIPTLVKYCRNGGITLDGMKVGAGFFRFWREAQK